MIPDAIPPHRAAPETVESLNVLGVPVSALSRTQLNEFLAGFLRSERRGWISYVNIHGVNLARNDVHLRDFLQKSELNYCDGEGVRLGARILGHWLPERIVLTEWVYDVFALAERERLRVFLLGGSEEVISKAVARVRQLYPSLSLAGFHHGYFSGTDSKDIVERINGSGADILIVGMGMPLQEEWIAQHFGELRVRIALNAGSCFDYLSGLKRRCPRWMANHGLEWVFRLMQEPRRLWKRYLVGNLLFMVRVLVKRFRSETVTL